MKKVLLIGGCGFLGLKTAIELNNKGFEVTIFDIQKNNLIPENIEFIQGDMLDFEYLKKIIANKNIVYNFAGIVDIDIANNKHYEAVKNNVIGNLNILESCVLNKIERYVFASSIYVYSEKGSFYKCSKQMSEILIEEYQKKFGLNYTVLRYGSIYGPDSQENNWVKDILKQAIKTKKIIRYGDGEEIREYIHVEDAAKASVDILKDEFINQNVLLTGNSPIKIKELLNMIKEMMNDKIEIVYDKRKKFEDHYEITPYAFKPKLGKKYIVNPHIDLGQGILDLLYKMSPTNLTNLRE